MRDQAVSIYGSKLAYDPAEIRAVVEQVFAANEHVLEKLLDAGADGLAVVKPNWINYAHEYDASEWRCVITHPELVLAVVMCLAERMGGNGAIAVCDAPTTQADFGKIVARGGFDRKLREIGSRWPRLRLEVIDLRREIWIQQEQVTVSRQRNVEDHRGYVRVDLGQNSLFHGHRGEGRYYGADYDRGVVNAHHRGELQEYLLSGTAMKCQLFVNLPKLKTHRKTGITCCLKNLVGINGDKNWLPHHVEGHPHQGGDEFPDARVASVIERLLKRSGQYLALRLPLAGSFIYRKTRNLGKVLLGDSRRVIRNGNWYGNDTCWRMVLDLNRALLHGDEEGRLDHGGGTRPYLAIVDAVVGGQGTGPTAPDPAHSGVLLAGTDPAKVDAVACRIMGFDPGEIPMVKHAFDGHPLAITAGALGDVTALDSGTGRTLGLADIESPLPGGYQPHFGWVARLGRTPRSPDPRQRGGP